MIKTSADYISVTFEHFLKAKWFQFPPSKMYKVECLLVLVLINNNFCQLFCVIYEIIAYDSFVVLTGAQKH